jgi:hypothetical protein
MEHGNLKVLMQPAELVIIGTASAFTKAGMGFSLRTITSPDADIAEDQIKTATGSYSATATISTSQPWVMQMATFRAAP